MPGGRAVELVVKAPGQDEEEATTGGKAEPRKGARLCRGFLKTLGASPTPHDTPVQDVDWAWVMPVGRSVLEYIR